MTPATPHTALPPPPVLGPMTQVFCQVGARVSLGPEPHAAALGGGTVCEPELNGTLVEGGVDWQINRVSGTLDFYRIA